MLVPKLAVEDPQEKSVDTDVNATAGLETATPELSRISVASVPGFTVKVKFVVSASASEAINAVNTNEAKVSFEYFLKKEFFITLCVLNGVKSIIAQKFTK